ncbi:MAG: polyprenyl synthetase family protein [Planctomycetaceae bacterium]|nr:polyprenyl synthetase family protein [Planctomycetaceae bacterium]
MSEDAYRIIAREMNAMETLMRQKLSHSDPFVDEIVRYSLQIGGKRLRPALVFLAGKFIGTVTEQHIQAAAAIELVHTASLIHDDILDGASVRRHLATFNVRWNVQVGVLAGDLLLTKALELITQTSKIEGIHALAGASKRTCEGELQQIGAAGRFDMSQAEYLQIIAGKTAPLLACSVELGALYASATPQVIERFRCFGQKLGLAFQIIDDVLDLVGEANTAGKTLQTDLIQRKPTLPLILYLQKAAENERREILLHIRRDDFNEQSANWVVARLQASGAIDDARAVAWTLLDEAMESLIGIEGDAETKRALSELARFVVEREK